MNNQAHQPQQDQSFEITPALEEAIKAAYASQRVTGFWLLTNSNGGCFVDDKTDRCSSFDRAWTNAMSKAVESGVIQWTFTRHDLRAKTGSDAKNVERAQELLGHSNPSMTRIHYRRKKVTIKPTK